MMTAQEADRLKYDGVSNRILTYIPNAKFPRPDLLGFRTVGESTVNWDGYINHYCLREGKLHLEAMTVNLSPEYKDFTPPNGERKTVGNRLQFYFPDFFLRYSGKIAIEKEGFLGGLKLVFVKGFFIHECPFSVKEASN